MRANRFPLGCAFFACVVGAGLSTSGCSGAAAPGGSNAGAAASAADAADGGKSGGGGAEAAGAGGDGKGTGTGAGLAGSSGDVTPTSLRIEPGTTLLEASGATPQTLQLTARTMPNDVQVTPIWTLDKSLLGSIDSAGLFTTSNKAGGVVRVTATYAGLTATATITVHYAVDIVSGSATPSAVAALFDTAQKSVVTTGPDVPTLVYPVNDTMFPQNLYRVLFQWRGHGKPLFQLEFSSPVLRVSAYTDGVHATCTQAQTGGACWESSVESWTAFAASNAGQSVTLKIRSLDNASAPTTIYESPAYTLHFSQNDVPGAIYYWSTTVAGVRRGTMGDVGPTNFLTPAQANNKCVACHTLSKNGKLLAADIGGETLGVVQVSADVPPPVNFGPIASTPTNYASAWATFDPDARFVVQSKGGVMTLRDATTGASVGANNGVIPLGANQFAVQPDWALDGEHVVFASNEGTKNTTKDRAGGTTLKWIATTITDGTVSYGSVETLQSVLSNVRYGYPMFNPTSEYIAFVRGKAIEKDLTDEVWLMNAAAGGVTPLNLTRANKLVSDGTTPSAGVENNMPTWAPTSGPDVQWVAFASKRDYGFVLCSPTGSTPSVCATNSKIGAGKQQIWIAAVDVAKLGSDQDPSYPAFRVPFMELTENCHRPFWALDALKDSGPGGAGGAGSAGSAGGAGAGGMGGVAGAAGGGGSVCVDVDGDCGSGVCCSGLECTPDANGDVFKCQVVLL